jgi:hypothetical protein
LVGPANQAGRPLGLPFFSEVIVWGSLAVWVWSAHLCLFCFSRNHEIEWKEQ